MGPVLVILIKKRFSAENEEAFEHWLLGRGITIRASRVTSLNRYWKVVLSYPINDGLSSAGQFIISLEDPLEYEEEKDQLIAKLGYFPEQIMVISAPTNAEVAHYTLSHFALDCAERYDGIIDLGGPVYMPTNLGESNISYTNVKSTWDNRLDSPQDREYPNFFDPGRVFTIYFGPANETQDYTSYVDVVCFRARLQSGRYHLIK